jgi:hypothetical protein
VYVVLMYLLKSEFTDKAKCAHVCVVFMYLLAEAEETVCFNGCTACHWNQRKMGETFKFVQFVVWFTKVSC